MNRVCWKPLVASAALPLLLAACATTTLDLPELDRAESAVEMLVGEAGLREFAPVEVREAEALLEQALERQREGAERPELLHLAQLTRTQVDIARETANLNRLEARVDELGARRELLRAEARAARAERDAARTAAERERARAEAARAEAERLAERQQRIAAERRAEALEAEARRMREEAERLQEQIAELEARPSDRGLVLTLGSDVLFGLDEDELREGAQRTIGRIAEFLNEYEERQVLVEGFTDSTGARDYNLNLSERRAASVRDALIERGVAASRISTRGYGFDYPVASNDTQAGRQLNRRVEVIISEDEQDVPAREE